jgi:hypothetical protein
MQYKSYEVYLLSDKWQKVKEDFNEFSENANGICFLCYEQNNLQLHHWRYPKDWNNDSYKNLIQLCHECHGTVHSIEQTKMLHNSYLFDTNSDKDLINYLSWVIKATKVMKLVHAENLANGF